MIVLYYMLNVIDDCDIYLTVVTHIKQYYFLNIKILSFECYFFTNFAITNWTRSGYGFFKALIEWIIAYKWRQNGLPKETLEGRHKSQQYSLVFVDVTL